MYRSFVQEHVSEKGWEENLADVYTRVKKNVLKLLIISPYYMKSKVSLVVCLRIFPSLSGGCQVLFVGHVTLKSVKVKTSIFRIPLKFLSTLNLFRQSRSWCVAEPLTGVDKFFGIGLAVPKL